jgi:hypothetical protein
VQAGRDDHRDAGEHPAPVEGDPDGAGTVLVAGPARRSPSRPLPSIPFCEPGPVPACWRWCCSRSSASTSR